MTLRRAGSAALMVLWLAGCARSGRPSQSGEPALADDAVRARLDVPIVSDQADAVVAVLERRATGIPPTDDYWVRLFATEGQRRLGDRERAFGRDVSDSTFRAFVMSDTLMRRWVELRRTLRDWKRVDPLSAALRAFDYLPDRARIRARVYLVIKPRTNSFVWEASTNPAIFLYVDPHMSAAQFENVLAHELHHIGIADACRGQPDAAGTAPGLREALTWMSGFAEGRAILAAAGEADMHPHARSEPGERARWDRDLAQVSDDMPRLEAFFFDLMNGRLSEDERNRRGFTFISTDSVPQGAFYTVGWLMASTVERELGRATLVASSCDPRRFIADYQRAVVHARNGGRGASLPVWSDSLLARISVRPGSTSP